MKWDMPRRALLRFPILAIADLIKTSHLYNIDSQLSIGLMLPGLHASQNS